MIDLIIQFSSGIIVFIFGLTTAKIIDENQAGLAVLRAHGTGLLTVLSFVSTLITAQFGLAAIIFYGLVLLILSVGGAGLILFNIDLLSALLGRQLSIRIGWVYLFSLCIGWVITVIWTMANRNLAAKLRET